MNLDAYSHIHPFTCSQPGCKATLPASKWDVIRSGWFFQRNGQCWCPRHHPSWVRGWRARRQARGGK